MRHPLRSFDDIVNCCTSYSEPKPWAPEPHHVASSASPKLYGSLWLRHRNIVGNNDELDFLMQTILSCTNRTIELRLLHTVLCKNSNRDICNYANT
jgi:hypothetical protein